MQWFKAHRCLTAWGIYRGNHYEKGGFDLASEELYIEYPGKKKGCKRDGILRGQTGSFKVTSPQPWHPAAKKEDRRQTHSCYLNFWRIAGIDSQSFAVSSPLILPFPANQCPSSSLPPPSHWSFSPSGSVNLVLQFLRINIFWPWFVVNFSFSKFFPPNSTSTSNPEDFEIGLNKMKFKESVIMPT